MLRRYEDAEPDPLDEKETGQLEWRVEKMRWRQNKPAGKPGWRAT